MLTRRPPEHFSRLQRVLKTIFSGPAWRNRTLLAVSLSVCGAYSGIAMIGPVRVLYAQEHGASLEVIGAMASAYLVSNFIFQYPLGWLADRWGRKQVMLLGLLVQAALAALYLLISDPLLFVLLRFLEGIAAASLLPSARALIVDIVPPEQQGEAFGIFGSFFNASFLIGPALGGLLASVGYVAAFLGAVVVRLIGAVLVLTLIHGVTSKEPRPRKTGLKHSPSVLFTWPLLAAYLLAFGDYLYLGYDLTLTPLWLHDHLGASVAMIGLLYTAWAIPNAICSPLGGRVADSRRRSALILIFGLVQVPIYIAYGLFSLLIIISVLFVIHGIVYAFIQPAIDAHLAAFSDKDFRARVQGLYTAVGLVGAFVGSNIFVPLYALDYRYPWFMMGCLYGLCVLGGGLIIRWREQASETLRPEEALIEESSARVILPD
jgi:MFS family permease